MKTDNEHEELLTVADRYFLYLFERQASGFLVSCPDIPSMSASGKTLTAARTKIHDEIGGCLQVVCPDLAW